MEMLTEYGVQCKIDAIKSNVVEAMLYQSAMTFKKSSAKNKDVFAFSQIVKVVNPIHLIVIARSDPSLSSWIWMLKRSSSY